MAVFVTDGNQRAALAVVRALGHAGIPVTVGESHRSSLAGVSRFCSRAVCYPAPEAGGNDFMDFLLKELRGRVYRVVLPITDISLFSIASAAKLLPPGLQLPFPDLEHIERAHDKRGVLHLAQQLGIQCPRTLTADQEHNLEEAGKELGFPVVIKPRVSRFLRDGIWASGSVQYAVNQRDLIEKHRIVSSKLPAPLVQERLQGEGRGVFLLIWNGELKAAFCHRRLREKPPSGGVSVYCESLPPDSDLVQKSYKLLKKLEWQGVAMVEYKIDRRDGLPKLMEINGRFWGSLQLAIDSGINFPLILYRLAMGEDFAPQFAYKVGVRSRWLLGDLDHLWIRLTHPRVLNGADVAIVPRWKACLEFMKFYGRHTHNEVLRLDDPSPGWYELKEYLRAGVRRFLPRGKEQYER